MSRDCFPSVWWEVTLAAPRGLGQDTRCRWHREARPRLWLMLEGKMQQVSTSLSSSAKGQEAACQQAVLACGT